MREIHAEDGRAWVDKVGRRLGLHELRDPDLTRLGPNISRACRRRGGGNVNQSIERG